MSGAGAGGSHKRDYVNLWPAWLPPAPWLDTPGEEGCPGPPRRPGLGCDLLENPPQLPEHLAPAIGGIVLAQFRARLIAPQLIDPVP